MICGEGIGLRLIVEEDLPLLAKWSDGDLTHSMFYSTGLVSEAGLSKWLKGLLSDSTRMRFAVQRLEGGATIGVVGLEHIDYRNQVGEVAGLIIDPTERKQGWGTKAVKTLQSYSFNDLNLHRLYVRIYSSNAAALCTAEKAGFKKEGVARDAVHNNWRYEDVVYLAVLREEWKHERAATTAI